MNRRITFGLVVLTTMAVSSDAWSYLPPSIQLLENLSARRAKLRLDDLTALLTAEISGVDAPVEERMYVKSPERLRLVQELPEGTRVYVEREGKRAGGPEGKLQRLDGASPTLLAALLMPRGDGDGERTGRLMSLLKSAGVDTRVVSLGIYGEDVRDTAFIIGAKSWEEDKAQLWIDREDFQPIRWVTYLNEDGERVRYESRFTGWGSPAGGAWFPEVIEIYRDGKQVRRSTLNEVRTNERLPESLFELP